MQFFLGYLFTPGTNDIFTFLVNTYLIFYFDFKFTLKDF